MINQPIQTDNLTSVTTYQQLYGEQDDYKFDYQYAISCWVFLDAAAPNMNESYNKYTSLLNFGNKPNILYGSCVVGHYSYYNQLSRLNTTDILARYKAIT